MMAAAHSAIGDVNHAAIDAYREGHYDKAALGLTQLPQDPVALYYLGRMRLYGYGELKNNTQALNYFKNSAERGHVPAMLLMGRIALNMDKNPAEALKWFKKAAEANNLYAQLYCIAAYKSGFGASKNSDYVERYAIGAAKNGNVQAQYTLGTLFIEGKYQSNRKVGVAWIEKAANKNYLPAIYALGQLYEKGEIVKKDELRAQALMNDAIQKGYKPAIATVGPVDAEKAAAAWLTDNKQTTLAASGYGLHGILRTWQNKNALEQNIYNQSPQMEITTKSAIYHPRFEMLLPNDVPIMDYYDAYIQAIKNTSTQTIDFPTYALVMPAVTDKLIEKAILGDSTAQFALGQLYQQGVGVKRDINEAIKYYNKSAAQQDLRAEYNLGRLYLAGENGAPDYQQAMGWLTDAAFKGSADAQYVLGQISAQGYRDASGALVIPVDTEQAEAMFYLGSANHHARSQYQLAELISRMPTQTLTVAEKEKRLKLLQSLYQSASTAGVNEADIPLAFFQAMSADKAQQTQAFNTVTKAAIRGNQTASFVLGLLYDRGIGVDSSRSSAISQYEHANQNAVTSFILGTYAALDNNIDKGKQLLSASESAGFSYAPLNLGILEKQNNQDFLPHLIKAREMGNHAASILIADYYLTQNNNELQLPEARMIYQQVAEKGDKAGQLKLGYMFEQGLGGSVDVVQAAKWYELAAQNGEPIAQYRLGRLNQLGRIDGKPNDEVAELWYKAAMNSYAPAAVALGFLNDTVKDDYQKAMAAYQIAANQGDTIGQFNLGLMYEEGKEMPVQYDKAESLYLSAAKKGHVQAMVQLGGLYLSGVLGSRDEDEALSWYKKAAAQGDRDALYHLGLFAETGVAMPLDYASALKYYQAAAGKGDAKAMLALARMYQFGQGVAKSSQEAETLYKELMAMGNGYAAYQLATMAYEGALGEQNKSQAQQWLRVAASLGSSQAEQTLLWQSAQSDARVSFIQPAPFHTPIITADEPVYWQYLGAVNAWNQGNERSSRVMLSRMVNEYPNYAPAKEAYRYIQSVDVWS